MKVPMEPIQGFFFNFDNVHRTMLLSCFTLFLKSTFTLQLADYSTWIFGLNVFFVWIKVFKWVLWSFSFFFAVQGILVVFKSVQCFFSLKLFFWISGTSLSTRQWTSCPTPWAGLKNTYIYRFNWFDGISQSYLYILQKKIKIKIYLFIRCAVDLLVFGFMFQIVMLAFVQVNRQTKHLLVTISKYCSLSVCLSCLRGEAWRLLHSNIMLVWKRKPSYFFYT